MKFKTVLSTALITLLVSSNAFASINLTINQKPLAAGVAPTVIDGRTLVPLRAIFEELGATVEWNDATKTVTSTTDVSNIQLTLNSSNAIVNGQTKTLDVPAQIIDGNTMVPVRFVAESLDCAVNWNADTQTVEILSKKEEVKPDETPSQTTVKTVYITKSGKKYHYDGSCNGGTYYESTLTEAEKMGLEPCSKCVK